MAKIEQIIYSRNLEIEKTQMETKLKALKNTILENETSCAHITVDLGSVGAKHKYRCLICSKKESIESQYLVQASEYMKQYDIKDDEQCNDKFDFIQTIAVGLLKDNCNISNEELVEKLNDLINEHIFLETNSNESGHTLIKENNHLKI